MPISNSGPGSVKVKTKTASTTIQNNATLALDADLRFGPISGTDIYQFEICPLFNVGAFCQSPNFQIVAPSGASVRASLLMETISVGADKGAINTVAPDAVMTAAVLSETGVVTVGVNTIGGEVAPAIMISGTVFANGCAPGLVGLAWGQAVSDPNVTTLLAHSTLVATKLA